MPRKLKSLRTTNGMPGEATLAQYGLDAYDWQLLFTQQKGECAICHRAFGADVLPVVDHCHAAGHVRGLLCYRCNAMLGHATDSQTILFRAAEYLGERDGRYAPEEFPNETPIGSPYRIRGYAADHGSFAAGDYLTVRRNGKVIAEVQVAVLPEGPRAPASLNIRRFDPAEFRRVRIVDDFA